MASARQLVFDILANNKASDVIKTIDGDLERSNQQWQRWQQAGTVAAGAVLGAATVFGVQSVNAYRESAAEQTKLQDAFARFPGLADTNIQALQDLNGELLRKTGIDDDATAAAQASLAAFGLTGTQIAQLTPLLQDYAVRTGKDMPAAAEDLGKAILGQGRALKDIGLEFTDTGTAAGNYDQLVSGLTSQVAGYAESQANAEGSTARMSAQFGELQEALGARLVPAFTALSGAALAALEWMNEHQGLAIGLGAAVTTLAGAFMVAANWQTILAVKTGIVTVAQGIATAGTWAWNTALAVLTSPITLVIVAIAALVAGIVWAYNNVDWFRNGVDAAFAWIKNAIATVADWWTGTVVPAWNAGYDAVAGVVQTASDAIGAAWQWISDAAGAAWAFIDTWVLLPFKIQIAVWQRVFEVASQAIGVAWEWIRSAAGAAWTWIQTNVFPPFEFAIASIRGVFEAYGQVAATVWEAIRSAIGTAWEWVRDNVFPPFETAVRAIQTTFEQVSDGIGTAWDKIREAAAAPVRFVVNTVYNDGIRRVVQNVLDALGVDFTLPTASLAFASGGVMPGYTPGSDVHHFWSPTAGALHLSGGEGIIRPDALRALGGASWLDMINRTRGKGLRFAEGGVFGGSGTGGITEFWEWITSPAQAIASLVTAPVNALLGQINDSAFGKVLKALPPKIIGGLVDKVASLLAPLASSGGGAEYGGAVGGWVRPSAGRVTSEYGARGTGFHAGIDVAAGAGAPTFAATNGSVYAQGWNVLSGRTGIGIILSHGGGTFTYYGHNPVGGVAVANGQVVATGQRIGAQGSTGNVTGPHLHFELHRGGLGRTVNPRVLGVFDQGGILGPGGVGANLSGRPERVLTPSNTASFDRLVDLLDGSEVNPRRSLANEVAEALSGATLRLSGVDSFADSVEVRIDLKRSRRAGVR